MGYEECLMEIDTGLEHKFARFGDGLTVTDDAVIEGYASLFGQTDQGGDNVQKGAYRASLKALFETGQRVKMLWQHDPAQPIGVWDEVREDDKGLWVKGRLLETTQKGREAAALIQAGAIDGLSIGYRTKRASKNDKGQRLLTELELWEVSLVTFPMLPSARVAAKGTTLDAEDAWRSISEVFDSARQEMARR
jgi:Escherichia/Staphylococcus phage prohead protease